MRRSFASLALAGAGTCSAILTACTLLIPFDEVPVEDAGTDAVAAPDVVVEPADDGGADVVIDARPPTQACRDASDGQYCGTHPRIAGYEGDRDDLVTCVAGEAMTVKHCASGTGCIRMVEPYPDQCDECTGRADGVYCGRDMPGWQASNANMRVRCGNGALVGILLCGGNGCMSNGDASACF